MKNYIKSFTFLTIVLVVSACSKKVIDPTSTPIVTPIVTENTSIKGYTASIGTTTIQLQPNAFMVRKDINEKLTAKTDNSLTYQNATETNNIKEGDILYSTTADKTSNGYAVVVTKKTVQGDKIVFETRPATMTEVFVKLNENQEFQTNFVDKPPVFFDAMDPANRSGRIDLFGLPKGLPLSIDRIKYFKISEKEFLIDYIFYDKDGNINTKFDQLLMTLKINHNITNVNFNIDKGLKISGEHKYNVEAGISYFPESGTTNKGLADVKADYQREILGKKITLFSVPLQTPATAATALFAEPSLDFYAIIEVDVDGRFIASVGMENFSYKFGLNFNNNIPNEFNLLPGTTFKASIDATAKGKLKLGGGLGLYIRFPLFIKNNEPSYAGLFSDFYANAEIVAGASTSTSNLLCTKFSVTPLLERSIYVEAKVAIVPEVNSFEQKYVLNKSDPIPLDKINLESCEVNITNADIKTGLVAYYPFTGNTLDSSGNKLNAVPFNGAVFTSDRNNTANRAYAFDGKNVLKVATSAAATIKLSDTTNIMNQIKNKLTLAAWINISKSHTGIFEILNKYQDITDIAIANKLPYPTTHFLLTVGPAGYISSSSGSCVAGTKLPANADFPKDTWVHVVSVEDGEQYKFYVNGVLIDTQNTSFKNCFDSKTKHYTPLYIGGNSSNKSGANGKIDNVYIFNRALTDIDVKALYSLKN